ncbi:OprD family outer membrane porin [Parendozoicomonas haliclonae]|uniref:Outer membrane porin, OprD family n=1 Tax=Parendozoicomonas haliclonae TaxID=1960125 RepID=A0A1X7ARA8_9GAMM|nr:OprD family outer membrane porin [Parendozoicomonas haliclonae]SMA50846.1 outer membrane porin, OprD family [Parendozoicomonas haliclonae]
MHFQKTIIALAIGAGLAAQPALANPFAADAKRNLDLINWETGNTFFDDASLDMKLRFVAYDRDSYRDNPPNMMGEAMYDSGERRDSALAVWLNYESGWLWDAVGFDLGIQGAKAFENRGFEESTQLWAKNDVTSAGKVGVANLKFRFGDEEARIDGRVGRMIANLPLISSDLEKAIPETYEGVLLNGHYGMVSGYMARFDGYSSEKSTNHEDLYVYVPGSVANPQTKDIPLELAGITLGKQGVTPTLSFHYGNQDDYLKKYMVKLEAGMPVGENFVLGQFLYHKQEGGKLYGDKYAPVADHKADMFAINLMAEVGQSLMLKAGYSQVGDDPYDLTFSNQILGLDNNTTLIWNDFNHANMKSVMIGGAYSLAGFGLEGLSLVAQGTYGWDAEIMEAPTGGLMPLTEDTAWEGVAGLTYEVFEGPLQGLWLNALYNRDGGGYYNHRGGRIMMDYTINFF